LPVSIGDLTISNIHFTGSATRHKIKLHFRLQIPNWRWQLFKYNTVIS